MAAWSYPLCGPKTLTSRLGVDEAADLPTASPYTLEPPHPTGGRAILLRHPIGQTMLWRCRNINLLPIDYAFRPRLRDRLTLGGFTFPRKPWVFGEQDSRLFYRYSYRHSHFHIVQPSLRSTFILAWNAPLPITSGDTGCESAASVTSLVPLIFGADLLDQ